jgi:ribosomal protein S18 acetylase RimI-like enzyme
MVRSTLEPVSAEQLEIRTARMGDLQALEEHLPVEGLPEFAKLMLRFQEQNLNTYLVAFLGRIPVGHLQIYWQGCRNKEVKHNLIQFPALYTIEVDPDHRSRGIGSAMMSVAERAVYECGTRGSNYVGLTVDVKNRRASDMYERRGYKYWNHPPFKAEYDTQPYGGNGEVVSQTVLFMFKHLTKRNTR